MLSLPPQVMVKLTFKQICALLMVIPLMIGISWNTIIGSVQPCNFIHFPKKKSAPFFSSHQPTLPSKNRAILSPSQKMNHQQIIDHQDGFLPFMLEIPRWTFIGILDTANLQLMDEIQLTTWDVKKNCITRDICHTNQCGILSLNGMLAIVNDIFDIATWQRVSWIIFHKLFPRKSYDCLYVYYVPVIYLLSGHEMTGSTFSISYK